MIITVQYVNSQVKTVIDKGEKVSIMLIFGTKTVAMGTLWTRDQPKFNQLKLLSIQTSY